MSAVHKCSLAACVLVLSSAPVAAGTDSGVSSARYPSIQAALDANPGKVVEVAPGVHEIHDAIRIVTAGGGLAGSARIIQTNPDRPIVRIDHAPRGHPPRPHPDPARRPTRDGVSGRDRHRHARPGPRRFAGHRQPDQVRRHRVEELRRRPDPRLPGPELSAGRDRRPDGDPRPGVRLPLRHRHGNPDQGMPGNLDPGEQGPRGPARRHAGAEAAVRTRPDHQEERRPGPDRQRPRLGSGRDRQLDAGDGDPCRLAGDRPIAPR